MQVACARTYYHAAPGLDSLTGPLFVLQASGRSIMAAAPPLSFAGALVLCLAAAQLAAASRETSTLRGAVACLNCAPRRNLSLAGVLVAVKCANGTGLRAAETDGRGRFEVAVPAAARRGSGSGGPQCAARILGGPEQLCAPPRFAASRVVVAGRERGRPGKYALASRLAVFTRCAATNTATATGADGATLTMEGLPGIDSPLDYNMGLPLNLFFPFFPVIGGGIP